MTKLIFRELLKLDGPVKLLFNEKGYTLPCHYCGKQETTHFKYRMSNNGMIFIFRVCGCQESNVSYNKVYRVTLEEFDNEAEALAETME